MSAPSKSTERPDVAAQIDLLNEMMGKMIDGLVGRIVLKIAPDLAFLASFDADRKETAAINAALAEHGCPIRLVWLDPTPDAATEVLQ